MLAPLQCQLFRLIYCSWMLNFGHRSIAHNIYSPKYFQIFFPNGGSCNVGNKTERGGVPDAERSRGCIATSYLPLPQFLPSDGHNWYYAETDVRRFISSTCEKFMSKKIILHDQETQDLDERWGGSALRRLGIWIWRQTRDVLRYCPPLSDQAPSQCVNKD